MLVSKQSFTFLKACCSSECDYGSQEQRFLVIKAHLRCLKVTKIGTKLVNLLQCISMKPQSDTVYKCLTVFNNSV